ncbi:MAG TPA: hypothetical protein PK411_14235 [Mesotoga infera]|jgi:hypothetical protein|nr:hypothetical protein [Mesotoga infera]
MKMQDFKRKFGAESLNLVNSLLRKAPTDHIKNQNNEKKEVQPGIFREMKATRSGNRISYFEEGMTSEVELKVIVNERKGLGGTDAFRESIE